MFSSSWRSFGPLKNLLKAARRSAGRFRRTDAQFTPCGCYVQLNSMRRCSAPNPLRNLSDAIREVDAALEETRAVHDLLALHIFTSRRQYRAIHDTKSGKRHALEARITWQKACELGFRGSLGEWDRLMGAAPRH
jgi:hypothetical protein